MKQHRGFEDPANRTPLAVEQTAPMAGIRYSLIVVWFHQEGHQHVEFPHRSWYPQKEQARMARYAVNRM
jgi:hypothetical protein